jgi:hypothetical protein
MTDETPDTNTETHVRQKPTRCYIDGDAFILRTIGQDDVVVPMPDVPTNVRTAMACEMAALLLLRGTSMADIVAGKGLPDRALPAGKREKSTAPRALNMVQRAILAVRIAELTRDEKAAAKAAGTKPDLANVAADSEAFVRQLTKDQTARHARALPVRIELERLRGGPATLDEAAADAPAVT